MNICLAVKSLSREMGGVTTHIFDLCKAYIREGHKVLLVADGTDFSETIDSIAGLEYIELPFKSAKIFPLYQRMGKLCVDCKIDIIHLHGQSIIPVAWLIRLKYKIPFVWTNHIDAIPQPYLLALMHTLFQFPIISVSNELKNDLMVRLKMRDENLYVVPNGTDFHTFVPLSEDEKRTLKQQYELEENEFVIAELARLNYGKGQDLLIRAIKALKEIYPERKFHVLFAGTGEQEWFEREVMEYAKNHQIKVTYLGFQKPRNVFGMANVSVLPSFYEGFSLVALESLAMECPVIRSNTPGWSHMNDSCLICEKGNKDSLVKCLDEIVREYDKWKAITKLCQNDIRQKFSKEEMSRATLEVYKKCLHK